MPTLCTQPSHLRPVPVSTFWFGACYYPEHWDEGTRREDAKRMRDAGMNVVRMAEFAAEVLEPAPGQFDFRLFDDVIEELARHGISTILGTPTAAPPRWFTLAHPDAVQVDARGVSLQHGSRQHVSQSHPEVRAYSQRVTRALAEHYAENPHVIGWQTDNEFNCHFSEDHSAAAQTHFQEFLAQKYAGDIHALNRAWGNTFWSLSYGDFSEIPTPREQAPTHANPSHQLDYARFLDWRITRFQREQVEILRAFQPKWFVFHNGCFSKIDYRGEFVRDLDFLGYDSYPFFSWDVRDRGAGHAFNLDRTRAWSGNFIIPEMQSGPGAQSSYFHDTPEPGEIRRMTYTALARGADSLLYFRWRTCRYGAEMYWCGILDHDNIPRRRYEEVARIGRELKKVGPEILGTSVQMDVAIALADYEAMEAHATLPYGVPGLSNSAETLHRWFHEQGYACGCAHPDDVLEGLSLFILPHWEVVNPAWIPNLKAFVERGGTLLIGARSGTRDRNNHVISETPPGVLAELAGVRVSEYSRKNIPDQRPWQLNWEGEHLVAEDWVEILAPDAGTEVLATWTSRHAAGTPAITRKAFGNGQVLYAASGLTASWIQTLGPRLCEQARLQPVLPGCPPGVEVVRRGDPGKTLWFFMNHNDGEVIFKDLPAGDRLVGPENDTLDPNDVMVISASTNKVPD
ncbi:MAG: beta-galactosidase [Verrucomicrobia bacterium]|nr:beta-galactosidase [Verrucomicrobiota bacterium]MCH8511037.1 beta-galactosidase [Kiritimatiellia bacterium]